MTLADFNALPYPRRIAHVFDRGHFLATRWQAEKEAVNLYELTGRFFAELTYDLTANRIVDVLAFDRSDANRLADYTVSMRLPYWLQEFGGR